MILYRSSKSLSQQSHIVITYKLSVVTTTQKIVRFFPNTFLRQAALFISYKSITILKRLLREDDFDFIHSWWWLHAMNRLQEPGTNRQKFHFHANTLRNPHRGKKHHITFCSVLLTNRSLQGILETRKKVEDSLCCSQECRLYIFLPLKNYQNPSSCFIKQWSPLLAFLLHTWPLCVANT